MAIKISGYLYYYKACLSLFSFSRILKMAEKPRSLPDENLPPTVSRDTAFELIERISKRLPACDNCMIRSLTALKLSRNYNELSILRIGVRNSKKTPFSAHAWLEEKNGEVIFEKIPDLSQYTILQNSSG